ncbi:DUF2914 domain-containing protein [Marinobacteraceae bacterium S3BR75-40.1]
MSKRTSRSPHKPASLKRDQAPRAEEVVVYHWHRIIPAILALVVVVGGIVWGGLAIFSGISEPETASATSEQPPADMPKGAEEPTAAGNGETVAASEADVSQEAEPPSPFKDEQDGGATTPEVNVPAVGETEETATTTPETTAASEPAPEKEPRATAEKTASPASVDIQSSKIVRASLTRTVRDHEPGDPIPAVVPMNAEGIIRVYFFTEMKGLEDATVYHDWYLDGKRMARVTIRPYTDPMRASSSKFINRNMLGDWEVKVHTASGENLAEGAFSVQGND